MNITKEQLLLYGVTERACLIGRSLESQIEAALQGGVTCLQLREKHLDKEELLEEAKRVKKICEIYQVPLILNDDVELMLASDADGVHVGQQDMDARMARELIGPDKILGVSARTVEQALKAEQAGADYLGVGAIFGTSTKEDAKKIDYQTLQDICRAVKIPVVAIGGVSAENVEELAGSGICGVAAVSAIFAPKDVQRAAAELKKRMAKMVGI
ncbi:MAG: thiamine phosphate synthase [Lachnospiraceae bacterium]|nr:thiamine phosphate synthase [Lachnospiraceae bacterium]MDD7377921.1 thiamine phosphate synthase [Lachnospiraceae bacterium]MDY4617971.1 thiamine phosphate synthase [Lachnospiraceae bacterium]